MGFEKGGGKFIAKEIARFESFPGVGGDPRERRWHETPFDLWEPVIEMESERRASNASSIHAARETERFEDA